MNSFNVSFLFIFLTVVLTSSCIKGPHEPRSAPIDINKDPCPVFDVTGIKLLDPESVEKVGRGKIWDEFEKKKEAGPTKVTFLNKLGSHKLSLIFHPGGQKNQFAEMELTSATEADQNLPRLEFIPDYVATRSVRIGQPFRMIHRKFSNYASMKHGPGKKMRLEIKGKPADFPCLKKYNSPAYYLEFQFDDEHILSAVKFGFPYP